MAQPLWKQFVVPQKIKYKMNEVATPFLLYTQNKKQELTAVLK
jgi:hypothetical protein